MTDTVTISRTAAIALLGDEGYHAFKVYEAKEELRRALSSPPPPSGLREALEEYQRLSLVIESAVRTADLVLTAIKQGRTALLAAPDGWVKVDETHPLPDDLTWGDETLEHHAYCKSPKVVAYRRRPSAEQGG